MKSLKYRFLDIQERNIFWSTTLCFAEAIKEQSFARQVIHRWFNKLVSKDDYIPSEKKEVLSFLVNLSNTPRTTKNCHKVAPGSKINEK